MQGWACTLHAKVDAHLDRVLAIRIGILKALVCVDRVGKRREARIALDQSVVSSSASHAVNLSHLALHQSVTRSLSHSVTQLFTNQSTLCQSLSHSASSSSVTMCLCT